MLVKEYCQKALCSIEGLSSLKVVIESITCLILSLSFDKMYEVMGQIIEKYSG